MNRIERALAALALGTLIAGTAVSAQDAAKPEVVQPDVYIDYDRQASLSRFKTFAVVEPKGDESMAERLPIAHRHLIGAIRKRLLSAGRLTEDRESPDVYISYRVASKEGMSLDSDKYSTGPGWRGGYYWAGASWGVASAPVDTYPVGTMVIDAWDARQKRLVWRGLATETISGDPKKVNKTIDSALDKVVKKWESMRAEGK
jgi:glycosyltransferase A (GT-A) superfamily protein (DUF2064 family)